MKNSKLNLLSTEHSPEGSILLVSSSNMELVKPSHYKFDLYREIVSSLEDKNSEGIIVSEDGICGTFLRRNALHIDELDQYVRHPEASSGYVKVISEYNGIIKYFNHNHTLDQFTVEAKALIHVIFHNGAKGGVQLLKG
jgi:hypothetical protein